MRVVFDEAGVATLDDQDDFKAFKVVAPAGTSFSVFEAVGQADGQHVWVSPEWLRVQREANDVDWHSSLAGMLAFASSKGWVDENGRIRAHVEVG